MNLHIKYRPTKLSAVVGNEKAVATVSRLAERGFPHAVLLTGPSGCGKTTMARIIRRLVGCTREDYQELNTADFRGIDTMRELRERMAYAPMGKGKARVWLLDECHRLTGEAQDAVLKLLEDTPSHVYLVLATTEPGRLITTIRNRCTMIEMQPLREEQLKELVLRVAKAEEIHVEAEAADLIVAGAAGSARAALVRLGTVAGADAASAREILERMQEEQKEAIELCRLLIKGGRWAEVSKLLRKLEGQDPEGIRRLCLAYFSKVLLGGNSRAFLVMDAMREPFYATGFPGLVLACYEIVEGGK